jgi:hypothetical protein
VLPWRSESLTNKIEALVNERPETFFESVIILGILSPLRDEPLQLSVSALLVLVGPEF